MLQRRLDNMCPLWCQQTGGWRGHQITTVGRFTGDALSGEIAL